MNNPFLWRLLSMVSDRLTDADAIAHIAGMSEDELSILAQREAAFPFLTLPPHQRAVTAGKRGAA